MRKLFDLPTTYLLSTLFSGSAIGVALILQHALGWTPCPLCILQRLAMLTVFIFSLAALLSRRYAIPSSLFRVGAVLAAVGGVTAAASHLWLLWGPTSQSCGPGLKLWVARLVEKMDGFGWFFAGSADCTLTQETLLKAPLPLWGGLAFCAIVLLLVFAREQPPASAQKPSL